MPNPLISQITLPTGNTYDIKDAQARADIETIKGAVSGGVSFLGMTTTPLSDGASTSPIIINDTEVNPINGALVMYGDEEFVWADTDSKWHRLGPAGTFGLLAYKDNASGTFTPTGTVSAPTFTGDTSNVTITTADNTNGNYQPKGTVSQPTFTGTAFNSTGSFTPEGSVTVTTKTTTDKTATVTKAASGTATYTPEGTVAAPTISVVTAGATETIKNPTSVTVAKTVVAAAPGATAPANNLTYYDVANENLRFYQLGYTTGASITTANVTVKTGDAAYEATAPEFTGTGARLVTDAIAVPDTYTATFTGDAGSVSVSGTATGTVSQPTFTGTKAQISGTVTPEGTISQPTFTGTQGTVTVS